MVVHNYEILYFAAQGNSERVQSCLASGIDPNTKDDSGYTPLHWAVQCNNLEMARILLDNHADINIKDINHHSPLWNAIGEGNIDFVNYLLDQGALFDDSLPCAAAWNQEDIADILIQKGAPVNFRDEDGCTPIYYAASHGYINMVKKLLAAGADPYISCNDGETSIDIARTNKHLDIVSLLGT